MTESTKTRLLATQVQCGDTTCASEPGHFCRFVWSMHFGQKFRCARFDKELFEDHECGWLQRLPECIGEEVVGEHLIKAALSGSCQSEKQWLLADSILSNAGTLISNNTLYLGRESAEREGDNSTPLGLSELYQDLTGTGPGLPSTSPYGNTDSNSRHESCLRTEHENGAVVVLEFGTAATESVPNDVAKSGAAQDQSSTLNPVQESSLCNDKPAKRQRQPRRQLTDLPTGWQPSQDHYKLGAELGMSSSDVLKHAYKFIDRNEAIGKQYKSWEAAFRSWLRNAKEWSSAGGAVLGSKATWDPNRIGTSTNGSSSTGRFQQLPVKPQVDVDENFLALVNSTELDGEE